MMNEDVKAEWVVALSNGSYDQGRRVLRSGDSFCCLGVLCDLYDPTLWDGTAGHYTYLTSEAMLPMSVMEWADLDNLDMDTLMTMNDEGNSFDTIANWIDANL